MQKERINICSQKDNKQNIFDSQEVWGSGLIKPHVGVDSYSMETIPSISNCFLSNISNHFIFT
jgi:hypothetical protein